jgi:gluconokinase
LRLFVVMGVSGSGKTTVGEALAPLLGGVFIDGDSFHSPDSIAKMSRGEPLTDDDRAPWLQRIGREMSERRGVVVAGCSALKRRYRDAIRRAVEEPVCFVHLAGSHDLIASRMNARMGHFMPPSLLTSQLAALEPPEADEASIAVDIGPPSAEVARQAAAAIRSKGFAY